MASSQSITPEAIASFRRDGFFHAKSLIDPREIEDHRNAVDHAVALRTRHDGRPLSERTPFEQSFTMCQYLWEDFPDVARLTFHPAIAGMARRSGRLPVPTAGDRVLFRAGKRLLS